MSISETIVNLSMQDCIDFVEETRKYYEEHKHEFPKMLSDYMTDITGLNYDMLHHRITRNPDITYEELTKPSQRRN